LTDEDPYHQGDNQVSIFNIDNPQTPVLIGNYGTANIYCIAAAGVRLFLGSNDGLSILDASDPRQLVLLSTLPLTGSNSGFVSKIVITGNTAFIAISAYVDGGTPKLWVVDISDPEQPKVTGELHGLTLPVTITDLSVAGNLAVLAGSTYGGVYD
jgi:hypothetical protein